MRTRPAPPSRADPVVRGVTALIGGPYGVRASDARRRFWVPIRVLLALTVVVCALGYAQKEPCRNPSRWVHEHQYTTMCYSDIEALYFSEGLDRLALPYRDHPVEYPVLIGGLMATGAELAHLFPAAGQPERFFDITALLLTVAALFLVWSTARLAGGRRVWDAALVALAPVLLLHAFTNWDLLAVALTGAGLLAWSRGRPYWAGVLLGLGVAAKLYPLLLIGALLLLCLRARRLRPWLSMLGAAGVTWLVIDLPVWIAYPTAFGRFWSENRTRPADFDTLPYLLGHVFGGPVVSGLALNLLCGLAFLVLLVAVAVIVFTAPRAPRVAQVGFLVLLAFLLANKVWSPQYALWLLPLAALARPRWPAFLAWQAAEVWLLFTRFYFFIGLDHAGDGLPFWVFGSAVLARDATLLVLAGLVIRDIYRPDRDPVRLGGAADPAAGPVLVGATA